MTHLEPGRFANPPAVFRVLHARRFQIGLLVATTVAILGLIEVSIRLVDPLGLSYFEESSRYHLEKVADADLIYRHPTNFRSVYQDVEVSFNEIGLRERPLQSPSPNDYRILLLGDSVTFGWGVPIEDTYGRQLDRLARGPAGEVVETINSGVGSYNTPQQLAFLRRHGDRLAPDLVTLLFVRNDLVPNAAPFDPWRKRSFAGKSQNETVMLLLGRMWTYRLAMFAVELSDDQPWNPRPESRGYRDAMESLRQIGGWCNERDIPFVVFVFHTHKGLSAGMRRLIEDIARIGTETGFRVTDISPQREGHDMRIVTNSVVDSHPNALGHAVLARGMQEFFEEHGFVQSAGTSR